MLADMSLPEEVFKMYDVSMIDWNEAWKRQSRDGRKQSRYPTCADRWSDRERCRRMDESVKANDWKTARERIRGMDISPESRVLDIGAGPGTLAIPLAEMVEHVTAVEPSGAMLEFLRENIRSKGLGNVGIVQQLWEDVDVHSDLEPPYDVVVASYSLGFPDLKSALEKMNDATSKYVYIFWFADGISPWQRNYGEVWERLFGTPGERRKPNVVFNLLNQMGIYANVTIFQEEHVNRFPSLNAAMASESDGLNARTPEQQSVLREFLAKKLCPEDGQYVMRHMAYRAMIWWKKRLELILFCLAPRASCSTPLLRMAYSKSSRPR
jgi:Methylase involved in ubiquinone/menaquinone biosynthesis